jgi:hypothetical protein
VKTRKLRWAVHEPRMVKTLSTYRNLAGKPLEGGYLGRPRRRWENNVLRYTWRCVELTLACVQW